jgi:histone-lysine N-methyltransferase ASH1L
VKNVQECRCGASNCRGILGPTPRDSKKPISKIDKQVVSGTKRKVGGLFGAAVEAAEVLSEKRRVPRMPKGWVYVDDDMEKIRVQEACDDRENARLQKEGISPANFELTEATDLPRARKNKKKTIELARRTKTEINGHGSEPRPKAPKKNSRRSDY